MTRLHLYPVKNLLRPRGTMGKESLSSYIYDRLKSTWGEWTNPEYGDSRPAVILARLRENLKEETEVAWEAFRNDVGNVK